jgi:hypothetical protein
MLAAPPRKLHCYKVDTTNDVVGPKVAEAELVTGTSGH